MQSAHDPMSASEKGKDTGDLKLTELTVKKHPQSTVLPATKTELGDKKDPKKP